MTPIITLSAASSLNLLLLIYYTLLPYLLEIMKFEMLFSMSLILIYDLYHNSYSSNVCMFTHRNLLIKDLQLKDFDLTCLFDNFIFILLDMCFFMNEFSCLKAWDRGQLHLPKLIGYPLIST